MPNAEKASTEKRPETQHSIPWHRVLEVPYPEKDVAKAGGARWDKETKRWFAPPEANLEKLSKWMITMLEVPFAEKDLAKAAGARWNRDAEFWFAPADAELDKLEKWIVTVLDVPFTQKDLAKAAGARWNNDLKLWHAAPGADLAKLDKWLPGKDRTVSAPDLDTKQAILDVPYKEKDLAKAAGARWNKNLQLWYAPRGSDLEKLNKWIPTPARAEELADAASKKRATDAAPKNAIDAARILEVPYKDKDLAKAAGAHWDKDTKLWFIPSDADEQKLARWKPTSQRALELLTAASQERDKGQQKAAPERPAEPAKEGQEPPNVPALHEMGIRPETLSAPLFQGTWRLAPDNKTVIFPHEPTLRGPVGEHPAPMSHEEIAHNHQVLAVDGAERSFWQTPGATKPDITKVVVVERAVDALSYHQLNPDDGTLYISTGGGPLSPEQKKTLSEGRLLEKLIDHPGVPNPVYARRQGLVVVAAFSNSKTGAQLARELKECLPAGVAYERNAPTHGRHWNDSLQLKEKEYLREQGVKETSKGLRRTR